jgi:hypothetical protein
MPDQAAVEEAAKQALHPCLCCLYLLHASLASFLCLIPLPFSLHSLPPPSVSYTACASSNRSSSSGQRA